MTNVALNLAAVYVTVMLAFGALTALTWPRLQGSTSAKVAAAVFSVVAWPITLAVAWRTRGRN